MRILMTSAAAVIALSAAAHAQDATPAPDTEEGATATQTQELPSGITIIAVQEEGQLLAGELIGTDIVNAEDETIGEITDLLMGEDGSVIGSVVSVGGFLGIGAKEVALPQSEIQFRRDENGELIAAIPVTREELEAGPDFTTREEAVALADQERLETEMATDQTGMAPAPAPVVTEAAPPAEVAETPQATEPAAPVEELAPTTDVAETPETTAPAAPVDEPAAATDVAETPAVSAPAAPAGEMAPAADVAEAPATEDMAGDRAMLEGMLGKPVEAADGAALGTVVDVVFGPDGGVEFVIVEADDKLTAVPWDRIQATEGAPAIVADTTPAEIEQMPAYEYSETEDTLTRPLAR
jgi:sporulation protein YlmC with PRC-barrel domain